MDQTKTRLKMKNEQVIIIGAGLAGCEAALFLADQGVKVQLFEQKPLCFSPAHTNSNFAELVCSNSLKSEDRLSASGLLKLELKELGCKLLEIAEDCRVPAGSALAVDRERFAQKVTDRIKHHPNITCNAVKVEYIDATVPTIVATGPLTEKPLLESLMKFAGGENADFFFYDAIAPIIASDSVDMNHAFWGNRYGDGESGDYLNCPLTREEYLRFYAELMQAKTVQLYPFEKVFEACIPVEVLAKRGEDSLRFGPMKPVGFRYYTKENKPYALVQLRKENLLSDSLNMVGFQTNLTFPEQRKVFSLIPALKNAEFLRYGTIHRNSYLCAPKFLNKFSQLKKCRNVYVAGQLSGVEGYMESIASGCFCAMFMIQSLLHQKMVALPRETCIGSLAHYLANAETDEFSPMNAIYGIIPFEGQTKNKHEKRERILLRSLETLKEWKTCNFAEQPSAR